jgi:GH25 family lysozyme M1 (1,4-beta-N-acetylmuramidase)
MTNPIFVDVYKGDLKGKPNWAAVFADLRIAGAIIKATEGLSYGPDWFDVNWKALAPDAAGQRPGFLRGAYHFLRFDLDGKAQADFYLKIVNRGGGFLPGDIIPIVDVELASERHPNHNASAQQVIDSTSAFSARLKELGYGPVMLYGNGAMRTLKINNRMGCDWLWIPRYTKALPPLVYERAGWTLDQIALWQYCGDGVGSLADYPTRIEGFGEVDISVAMIPDLSVIRQVEPAPAPLTPPDADPASPESEPPPGPLLSAATDVTTDVVAANSDTPVDWDHFDTPPTSETSESA